MKSEARDLRDLALEIEDTCRRSRAYSMAWPAVTALSDYLSLRARVMELEDSRPPEAEEKTRGL